MRIYVNSAGRAPEHDYRWTVSEGNVTEPCFARDAERRVFFEAFGCGELLKERKPRLVLARSADQRLLVAAIAFPTLETDYSNRPIRVTACWVVAPEERHSQNQLLGLFQQFERDWGDTLHQMGRYVKPCPEAPGYTEDFAALERLVLSAPSVDTSQFPSRSGVLRMYPGSTVLSPEEPEPGKVLKPVSSRFVRSSSSWLVRSATIAGLTLTGLVIVIGPIWEPRASNSIPPPTAVIPPPPTQLSPKVPNGPMFREAQMALASTATIAVLPVDPEASP